MADVQVFVDDAVRGTLPEVCAKDGVPTTDQLRFRNEIGNRAGLGVAWLLVLAGPLGWLGILVLSAMRGGQVETLTVQLPLSATAYQQIRTTRRQRRMAAVVAVLASVGAFWLLVSAGGGTDQLALILGGATAIGAVVAVVIADHRFTAATVSIELDASRRWVTIHRVHPAFAAACQAHEQQRSHQRT